LLKIYARTNSGNWSRERVIDLEAEGQPGEFQLVISRASRRAAAGIEHYTVKQFIRRETKPDGRILAVQKIFEGVFLETINVDKAGRLPDYLLQRPAQKARRR
jgi:hypothetical protein